MSQIPKLERIKSFNATEFNKEFEDMIIEEDNKVILEDTIDTYDINDIGIKIKNFIFKLLDNGRNPIKYIKSSSENQLYASLIILTFGVLLLFLSNILY